jgi:hypothetical protein
MQQIQRLSSTPAQAASNNSKPFASSSGNIDFPLREFCENNRLHFKELFA